MMNKKGQFANLQGIVISLVVIACIIGISFMVLQDFKANLLVNGTEADAWAGSNTTNFTFTEGYGYNTTLVVKNATGGETVAVGNYTVYQSGGYLSKIILTNASYYKNDSVHDLTLYYTYTNYGEGAYQGVNKTMSAMDKIPQWLGIIVILGIVGIILGLIFSVFPRTGIGAGRSSTTAEI